MIMRFTGFHAVQRIEKQHLAPENLLNRMTRLNRMASHLRGHERSPFCIKLSRGLEANAGINALLGVRLDALKVFKARYVLF